MSGIDQASDLNSLSVSARIQLLYNLALQTWNGNTVLATLMICQAIQESALLNDRISGLATKNNLFGIKGEGTAGESTMSTTEVINGQMVLMNAGFAMNNTISDSFDQYKSFLADNGRYSNVLSQNTVKGACQAMGDSGYATDPNYGDELYHIYLFQVVPILNPPQNTTSTDNNSDDDTGDDNND